MRDRWEQILRQTEEYRTAAESRGLVEAVGARTPVRIEILPPATASEISSIEGQIGCALPSSLRTFFMDATAGLNVEWSVPGREHEIDGLSTVDYHLIPPPPFQYVRDDTGEAAPLWGFARVCIRLSDLPNHFKSRTLWRDSFVNAMALFEDDESSRVHYRSFVEFWDRGFPIADVGTGDICDRPRRSPRFSHDNFP